MLKTTVICVLKLGGDFSNIYVRRLQNAIKRHLNTPYEFVCLTDDTSIDFCRTISLKHNWKGWWSKIELFRPDLNLGNCLYFDLDTLILGNIDDLVKIAQKESFIMLRGFHKHSKGESPASGIMAGNFAKQSDKIYKVFVRSPQKWISRLANRTNRAGMRGDQGFIVEMVGWDIPKLQHFLSNGYIIGKRNTRKQPIVLPLEAHVLAWSGRPRFHMMQGSFLFDVWKGGRNKKILIQFPTRQRPEQFKKYFLTYIDLLVDKSSYEIHVSCDTEDKTMNNDKIKKLISFFSRVSTTYNGNKSKIEAINKGVTERDWDILILASDDMFPLVEGYDNIIRKLFEEHFPDGDGVLHFNDGFQKEKLNTLCVIGRKYYNRFGYIYYPGYKSFYADNEFDDVSRKLDKRVYIDQVIIEHRHPGNYSGTERDGLYKRNARFAKEDQKIYNDRKK